MKVTYQLLFVVLILFSCQNEEAGASSNDITTTYREISGEKAKKTAAIVIEGMSCEMACVSAVNKTITALNGTNAIDMHFDAAETLDTCFVEFDDKVITPIEMANAIESCNGGIYKVKSIEVIKTITGGASINTSPSSISKTTERENVSYSNFKFPSLMDLIKGVGL